MNSKTLEQDTSFPSYIGIIHALIAILFIGISLYSLIKGINNFYSLKDVYTSYNDIIFDKNTIEEICYTILDLYIHIILFIGFLYAGIVGLKNLIIES